MKIVKEKLRDNWRKLIGGMFLMFAFLMPATRDFLSEIFDVTTYASNNENTNHNNNQTNSSKSESVKSVSSPDSLNTASPMKNSNDDSTKNHTSTSSKKNKPNGK